MVEALRVQAKVFTTGPLRPDPARGLSPVRWTELAPWAVLAGEMQYRAWGELLYTVTTGQSGFQHAFGMPWCEYVAQHSEMGDLLNCALATGSAQGIAPALLAAYAFAPFFEAVPHGGDAYMLGRTIRDWDDDQVVTILKNCHDAMAECGTLLIEPLLTGDHGSAFEALGALWSSAR